MRGFISAGLAALAGAFTLQVAHAGKPRFYFIRVLALAPLVRKPRRVIICTEVLLWHDRTSGDRGPSIRFLFYGVWYCRLPHTRRHKPPRSCRHFPAELGAQLPARLPYSRVRLRGFILISHMLSSGLTDVYRFGDISDPKGLATGGHFNPFNATHACEDSEVRHAGDIGNVQADAEGKVIVTKYVKASLIPGEPDSIFGRGVIVHEKADGNYRNYTYFDLPFWMEMILNHSIRTDCVTQPTGNAGGRFAQGVIGFATSRCQTPCNHSPPDLSILICCLYQMRRPKRALLAL